MTEDPDIRKIGLVYAMLAPWSLHRARWVASRRWLIALAEQSGAPLALVDGPDSTILGIPVRVDESVSGLLLEWR